VSSRNESHTPGRARAVALASWLLGGSRASVSSSLEETGATLAPISPERQEEAAKELALAYERPSSAELNLVIESGARLQ